MSGGKSSEQTVGYKYYAGAHLVLTHGPIDKITKFEVDGRTTWEGSAEASASPVRVNINKPSLFGGESREGGISGALDVLFGYSTQPRSDYLLSKIGSSLVPAYRGVTSLVLRQMYLGNNPYLKPWAITAQRIHLRGDGVAQWYDEKAEVLTAEDVTAVPYEEDFSEGLDAYTITDPSKYSIEAIPGGKALRTLNGGFDDCYRDIPEEFYDTFEVTGRINERGIDDPSAIILQTTGGTELFGFVMAREAGSDVQRRPQAGFERVIYDQALDIGAWYRVLFKLDWGAATFIVELYDAAGLQLNSVQHSFNASEPIGRINFRTQAADSVGSSSFTDIKFSVTRRYETGDMNPAHIIRECLTDSIWGRGLPETEIGPSYATAADQLYDEGLGLSLMWTEEGPIDEFIAEVMRHIDAVRYEDPETGLQEIELIRGDYDIATLAVLDPSNSKVTQYDPGSATELINQVTVEYWNRAGDSDTAITVQDTAAITQVGSVVNATYNYPGITRDDVAMMVAQRDLASGSRPYARGTVVTNRAVANLKPGSVFKLTDPDLGISSMVCRVAKRKDNGLLNGEITLEWGEDVFASQYSLFAVPPPSGWVDPLGVPQDFSHSTAFETPYSVIVRAVGDSYIGNVPEDAGYYAFAGTRPAAGVHLNYHLYVYPDGTSQPPDFEVAISTDFTPFAVTSATVDDPLETLVPIDGVEDPDSVRVGHLVLIGEGPDDLREIAAIDAAVTAADTTLTLARGVADTVPRPIPAGTVLYIIGTDAGYSETEYLIGETAEGYGTPVNGQGHFEGPFTYHDLTMAGRFVRPYPPADVTIGGEYWPATQSGDIVVAWAERNRVTQSDQVVPWTEPTIAPEAGTSYTVTLYGEDGGQILQDAGLTATTWTYTEASELALGLTEEAYSGIFDYTGSLPTPGARVNSEVRVTASTQRDGEDSLQTYDHTAIRDGYGYSYGKNYGGH